MINKITLFIISLLVPMFCSSQSLEAKFQQKLDTIFQQNKDAVGAIIHVEFPDKNISWTSAVGFSDKTRTVLLS